MTYGYFEYCISWINFFGDHRFKHPWNHHQFHNMILWNFVEIIIFIKLLIDDDFNKISQYHIVKLMMVSWMLEHMIAKKVNSTDAIFKITICHWSPLMGHQIQCFSNSPEKFSAYDAPKIFQNHSGEQGPPPRKTIKARRRSEEELFEFE